jgi:hypothetical protein
MDNFVYFYGTNDGSVIKIGHTRQGLKPRRVQHERNQLTDTTVVLLAAVHASPSDETAVKSYFAGYSLDNGRNNTERFAAAPEVTEYVNWLRQQYFIWTNEADGPDDLPSYPAWCPEPTRRVPLDKPLPDFLIQDYDVSNGELSGTPWAAMARPRPPHNDYYTPVTLIDAARAAMGGIDLDPASHWVAARAHGIENYYHQYRSAFDNPWAGRVWLNPPYGENRPWFNEIVRYWDAGEIQQLCMLSPVWAFNTVIARPVIARSSTMLLLSPTPKFWGRQKRGRIVDEGEEDLGVNHPHAILYMGLRTAEFRAAFEEHGILMRLDYDLTSGGQRPA